MEFGKNLDLLNNICLLQIRSAEGVVNIPQLTSVYHTPSKISLSKSYNNTAPGVLHKTTITLTYPGLSKDDFDKFSELTRGVYQIFFKLDNNDIYEAASGIFPMSCACKFNLKTGHQISFKSSSPIPVKFRENQPDQGINITGFNYEFDFYVS